MSLNILECIKNCNRHFVGNKIVQGSVVVDSIHRVFISSYFFAPFLNFSKVSPFSLQIRTAFKVAILMTAKQDKLRMMLFWWLFSLKKVAVLLKAVLVAGVVDVVVLVVASVVHVVGSKQKGLSGMQKYDYMGRLKKNSTWVKLVPSDIMRPMMWDLTSMPMPEWLMMEGESLVLMEIFVSRNKWCLIYQRSTLVNRAIFVMSNEMSARMVCGNLFWEEFAWF